MCIKYKFIKKTAIYIKNQTSTEELQIYLTTKCQ